MRIFFTYEPQRPNRTGWTLVELLVVISIIGLLIGLLLPAVNSVRDAARRTECSNNIRNQVIGLLSFESARGSFPPGAGASVKGGGDVGWMAFLLPYVEQNNLAEMSRKDFQNNPYPLSGSHRALGVVLSVYQCSSDPASGEYHIANGLPVATTSYQGVCGTDFASKDGVLYYRSMTRHSDIRDGLSNTLIVGERPASLDRWYGWWYAGAGQDGQGSLDFFVGAEDRILPGASHLENCPPGPYTFSPSTGELCDTAHFWSYHGGGGNFAKADGSVAFLSYDIDTKVFKDSATRSDGF